MKVQITDNEVIITLPRINPPEVSKSEKSKFVANSNGYQKTDLEVNGEQVRVSAMAIIKNR